MKSQANKKRVFIGMSGGVDSSVSAALLKKAGYEVTGVFIKVWQPDWLVCNWKEDRRDAMRVAAHLGISFLTLNLEKEYKQEVFDYMIREYKAGLTPNPDVMCNKSVKFGAFYNWAIGQGANFVATGHYSQIRQDDNGSDLIVSSDSNKDQTYFIWNLKQEQLKHILFPIGHLVKTEVRKYAKKFRLPNADKKDSQGLCFIGNIDMKEFLSHYIKTKEGNVLNIKGEVIGKHPGALLFTIGERHGFNIIKKTPNDTAYYIIGKDIENNTITVGKTNETKESANNDSPIVVILETNWINKVPIVGKEYLARTRYRQIPEIVTCTEVTNNTASFKFMDEIKYITPGQSLVLYNDNVCLGGGVIQ